MSDSAIAVLMFALFAVVEQWCFRCQRVGRGILLRAKDGAAAYSGIFSHMMPTRFVVAVWLGRILWISAAVFAWRAWRWPGLIAVFLYPFVVVAWVDIISPWPSHSHLLSLIHRRISSGAVGVEGAFLLIYVSRIEKEMRQGISFEKATLGAWLSRASEAMPTKPTAGDSGQQDRDVGERTPNPVPAAATHMRD